MANRSATLLSFAAALAVTISRPSAAADGLEPSAAGRLAMAEHVGGLDLVTALEFLPDGRLAIAEKGGRLLLRHPSGKLTIAATFDVDQATEKGLLNVIRHPDFESNRELVFYYSAADASAVDKHKISRIRLGEDGKLDFSTEKVLVEGLRGPDDHEQGGGLAIDGAGKLLIGVGDTGCRARKMPEPPYTPANYFATCLSNANGKILRINLDGTIPEDNPLVGAERVTACGAACGDDPFEREVAEPRRDIWVWGVRNPWRVWVDPETGYAWFGDVGDIAHEEINLVPPKGGAHYGWPWREGAAGHPVDVCTKVVPDAGPCVEPAYYCRQGPAEGGVDGGCKSINGGLIVDDCRWPDEDRGLYYFGDNANGKIWTLSPTEDRRGIVARSRQLVGQVDGFVVDMEIGPDGGLYVAVMRRPPGKSRVIRIAPKHPRPCAAGAAVARAAATSGGAAPVGTSGGSTGGVTFSRRPIFLGLLAFVFLIVGAVVAREEHS